MIQSTSSSCFPSFSLSFSLCHVGIWWHLPGGQCLWMSLRRAAAFLDCVAWRCGSPALVSREKKHQNWTRWMKHDETRNICSRNWWIFHPYFTQPWWNIDELWWIPNFLSTPNRLSGWPWWWPHLLAHVPRSSEVWGRLGGHHFAARCQAPGYC